MSGPARSHDYAAFGVFDAPPQFLGGTDVQCPVCGEHSPPGWRAFQMYKDGGYQEGLKTGKSPYGEAALAWMWCANEECEELIVQMHEQRMAGMLPGGGPMIQTDSWIVRPRFGQSKRRVNSLVPEPFRTDYLEAAAILNTSPRMSAVLSRSILADLLKKYAAKGQFGLKARIDSFVEDGHHPSRLTENLQHFREIANFGAHTQEDQQESDAEQALIIPVELDEAEWTLDLVDRLFDYFIVAPHKDDEIKQRMDGKIERAGRPSLRPDESTEAEDS